MPLLQQLLAEDCRDLTPLYDIILWDVIEGSWALLHSAASNIRIALVFGQQYVFHVVRGTKEAAHILLVRHRPNLNENRDEAISQGTFGIQVRRLQLKSLWHIDV